MSSDRIEKARELSPGDVVTVAVQLRDKVTGASFWWKTLRCVHSSGRVGSRVCMLTLKPQVSEKDLRVVDLTRDVVTKLDESEWPQGAIAMRMKYIALGYIKLDSS